jgi:hypothetical protein
MSSTPLPDRPSLTTRVPMIGWILGLAALAVGAIVALFELDDGLGLALACAALLVTVTAIAVVARDELARETEEPASGGGTRWRAAGLAVAAAVLLTGAVVIATTSADETATAASATGIGTSAAIQTVRDFLTAALVQSDGESVCGYLTPAEQLRVGAVAGHGASCREAADASLAAGTAGEPTTVKQIRDLPARATRLGTAVRVTTGRGVAARSFVLAPTTAAERESYGAPAAAWRISSGATAVLTGTG